MVRAYCICIFDVTCIVILKITGRKRHRTNAMQLIVFSTRVIINIIKNSATVGTEDEARDDDDTHSRTHLSYSKKVRVRRDVGAVFGLENVKRVFIHHRLVQLACDALVKHGSHKTQYTWTTSGPL